MKPTQKAPVVLTLPALLIGGVLLGTLTTRAQTAPQKVALINVAEVLKASPGDAAVVALGQKRDTELGALDAQIQPLLKQGSQISAADKTKLDQLIASAQSKSKDYDAQISAKLAPMTQKANAAVAAAAKANGVAVVLNANTAQESGIIVYADPSADLTSAVKTALTGK